jgi:hypothetical protein
MGSHQSPGRHQPDHPLLGAALVESPELVVDPGRSIGGPRTLVDSPMKSKSSAFTRGVLGLGPPAPVVVARARNLQGVAEPLDGVVAGVIGDEPEAGHRVVSLAK